MVILGTGVRVAPDSTSHFKTEKAYLFFPEKSAVWIGIELQLIFIAKKSIQGKTSVNTLTTDPEGGLTPR